MPINHLLTELSSLQSIMPISHLFIMLTTIFLLKVQEPNKALSIHLLELLCHLPIKLDIAPLTNSHHQVVVQVALVATVEAVPTTVHLSHQLVVTSQLVTLQHQVE